MTHFHYKGLQGDGTVVEGDLDADVQQEAYRQMEYRGLRLIKLTESHEGQPADAPAETGPVADARA